MKCPHCRNKVLQKSGTETRLRTTGPISFDAAGVAHSQCYWCKQPIEINELQLSKSAQVFEEHLIIRKP